MDKTALTSSQSKEYSSINGIRYFPFVFLPFAFLLLVASVVHYYSIVRTERVTIDTQEILNVGLARSSLNTDLATGLSDLKFLANYFSNQGFDASGDIRHEEMVSLLLAFSQQKGLFDQVRFIDIRGNEKIRINYKNGHAESIPCDDMQNKKDRYYFTNAINLKPEEVYISRFDLNIENGEVEQPLKPVIRFAMSISDQNNIKRGIIVLNYLGEKMLKNFVRNTINVSDHIHLVNSNGYWLHSPREDHAWGFVLSHNHRFPILYPRAWLEIKRRLAGQIRTDKGLFSFERVTPLSVANQRLTIGGGAVPKVVDDAEYWYVISHITPDNDVPSLWRFLVQNSPLYLSMLVLIIIGTWLLTMSRLRHRRAEMVNEYERRFRNALENMTLLSISLDVNAKVSFCNDAFVEFCGWKREDIIQKDWSEQFVVAQQRDQINQIFAGLKLERSIPEEIETEIMISDGRHRLVSWHNTLTFDGDGHVTGITAIGEDITEKRQNENQVRKLSKVVEQSPSTVMLTDRFGLIEYVNPKFSEVTGYTSEEVVGLNPRFLKSGETSDAAYGKLWETLQQGNVWQGEFHNRRKNGELYWESAAISALRDDNGQTTNYIAVKEDITERKRLQAELEQRQKEMVRNQALTAMGRMAGEIAHDLRNPLSSVKMAMQILGRQVTDEQKELKEIGLGQVSYMENIITDMLAYARPDSIKSEYVDINQLLEIILKGYEKKLSSLNINVEFKSPQKFLVVTGDPDKLQRLFSNLISNAIQALNHEEIVDRRLLVSASLDKEDELSVLKILICDSGAGLGENEVDKLFEPFFTTQAKGTGLGLAIVRQIAEQHGGSVDLARGENSLTCARVILPPSEP